MDTVTTTAPAAAPANTATGTEANEWSVNEPDETTDEGLELDPDKKGQPSPIKPPPKAKAETEEQKEAKAKRKLRVDKEEFEVDEDQFERLAQKGAFYEKKNYTLAKREREVTEHAAKVTKLAQEAEQLIEWMGKDPVAALRHIYKGDDAKVRQAVQPYLADRIREEMEDEQNPHQKAIRQANAERDHYRQVLEQQAQEADAQRTDAETQHFKKHYEKLIVEGLATKRVPQTERASKMMAEWMSRGIRANIEYTPDQVAELVREEYQEDIRHFSGPLLEEAKKAKAAGNNDALVALGDQALEMYGEELINLIRMSDLARLRKQRQVPNLSVVEGQRTGAKPEAKKEGYMDWDKWQEERKQRAEALSRGEKVAEW